MEGVGSMSSQEMGWVPNPPIEEEAAVTEMIAKFRRDRVAIVIQHTSLLEDIVLLIIDYAYHTNSLKTFLYQYEKIRVHHKQYKLAPLGSFNGDIQAIAYAALKESAYMIDYMDVTD